MLAPWNLKVVWSTALGLLLTGSLLIGPRARGGEPSPEHILNLAPATFLPSNNASQYAIEEGGLGELCLVKGAGYFVAPIVVSDGAVIERISARVVDKSIEGFGLMSLLRRTPEKTEVLAITSLSTGEHQMETLSTDTVADGVVNNDRYTYLLQVMLSAPRVCLHGAQVTYRLP